MFKRLMMVALLVIAPLECGKPRQTRPIRIS